MAGLHVSVPIMLYICCLVLRAVACAEYTFVAKSVGVESCGSGGGRKGYTVVSGSSFFVSAGLVQCVQNPTWELIADFRHPEGARGVICRSLE